jgi:hypothetical protein
MDAAVKKINVLFLEKCIKNKVGLAEFKLIIADQIVSKYSLNPNYSYHTSNGLVKQDSIANYHIAFSNVSQSKKVEESFRDIKGIGSKANIDNKELNFFTEALNFQKKMVEAFTDPETIKAAKQSILNKTKSQNEYNTNHPTPQKPSFISTIIDFLKSLFGFETSFEKQKRENAEKWAIRKNDPQTTPGNSRLSLTTKS